MERLNGQSFTFNLGYNKAEAIKCSVDITDNSKVAMRGGLPDGDLPGDMSAAGTLTVDAVTLKMLTDAAKKKGSFKALDPIDIHTIGKAGAGEYELQIFGCKLKLNKLADVDTNNSDETFVEVPFDVTSKDFVKINGVPYAVAKENKWI